MSDRTAIEWTEMTWNPTTGCDRVSPGCGLPLPGAEQQSHGVCYALRLAARLKAMGQPRYQRDGNPRTSGPGFGLTVHPGVVNLPLRWRRSRMVFVNSMSDLFHDQVPAQWVAEVFAVMAATPRHTYQVLTKRHARMRAMLSDPAFVAAVADRSAGKTAAAGASSPAAWPLPNVWLGVSTETQRWAGIRVPVLLDTPASVRWVSVEPLLDEVDLSAWLRPVPDCPDADPAGGLNWVVAGGESGDGARSMAPAWVRGLREQCRAAGVPFFFKQWGGRTAKAGGRELDGRTWDEYPAISSVRPAGDAS